MWIRGELWLMALLVVGCAQGGQAKPTDPTVLALGDSIAFGYNPISDKNNPDAFVSYAQLVAEAGGSEMVNLACGGETTGSLVSRDAPDNGCRDWRSKHPLHFDYETVAPGENRAVISQLEVAVDYLRDPAQPAPDAITIDIGGNDLLLFAKACPPGDNGCLTGKIPDLIGSVLPHAQANVDRVFSTLRGVGGYQGPIVVVTTYALDYSDPIATFALDDLNKAIRDTAGHYDNVRIADGYEAFRTAAAGGSACAAGLLYPMGDGTCDIHPSIPATTTRSDGQSGAALLADTVRAALQ
jgi:lysophospholipase L1-like esterase